MVGRSLALASALLMVATAPAQAAERAFIALDTADIGASEKWYATTFRLKRVNRFDRPKFDQRILLGTDLIVELVQTKPPAAKSATTLGIVKAGVAIADFDRRLAAWRKNKVAPAKGGLVFDEAIGLASIQLTDPDGNLIQVFGKSTGPFDFTVKVDPAFGSQRR